MICKLVKKGEVDHWCERHQRFHAGHHTQWATGLDELSASKRATWDKLAGLVPEKVVRLITPPVLPDVTVKPTSDLLVITVAVEDEGRKLHEVTGPGQRAYAERCGADYVAIDGPSLTPEWTMMDKFRVHPYLKHYKRYLYLDADAFVSKRTPSLFEIYPEGIIAAHDDTGFNKPDWNYLQEVRDVCATQGLPVPDNYRLLNSGVVLFCEKHKDIWSPPYSPMPNHWCAEQHLEVIRMINAKVPWVPLPRVFNWEYWIGMNFPDPNKSKAWIIHGAGYTGFGGSKEDRVKWLANRVEEEDNNLPFFTLKDPAPPTKLTRPKSGEETERCKFIGLHLTQVEVNEYRQQLLEGKIPCRTCQGNAPDGIPARHCSSPDMGPFTWQGKCQSCKGWAEQ